MGKIILRLTESELRQMVIEAVNGVLQQQNTPANSIARLIYDTTGINVNEAKVANYLVEAKVEKNVNSNPDYTNSKTEAEEINKKNLLKNILIDFYDGVKSSNNKESVISSLFKKYRKYVGTEEGLRKKLADALTKYNGDDVFKKNVDKERKAGRRLKAVVNPDIKKEEPVFTNTVKDEEPTDKNAKRLKLKKPVKKFRDDVLKVARQRVVDKIGAEETDKILGPESKSRSGFESQLRGGKKGDITTQVGDMMDFVKITPNEVQPENGDINSPEFKNHLNALLIKYLDGNATLAEMLLDYYSCGNFAEVARKYNMYKQRTTSWITKAVETLRNSVGFKKEVSDLLNGKYDQEKVKSDNV